jgi:hypothetical protein
MALKLIADRVLPNQAFAHSSKGNNAVQINISGLTVDVNSSCSDVQEKEVKDPDVNEDFHSSDIEGEVIR